MFNFGSRSRIRELAIGSIPDVLNSLDNLGGHGFKLVEERSDMFKVNIIYQHIMVDLFKKLKK